MKRLIRFLTLPVLLLVPTLSLLLVPTLSLLLVPTVSLLLVPTVASAQFPQGMDAAKMMEQFGNPAAMQEMAAKAQAMQQCMAKIDRAKLDALQVKAQKMSEEIDRLCKAGKKDEALKRAMTEGKKMQSDATVKAVGECSKGMAEMMKDMPFVDIPEYDENHQPTSDEICS